MESPRQPALDFRLSRDGRNVPFAVTGGNDYTAMDPWPADNPESRAYTLFARRPGEPWLALAERTVRGFFPDPRQVHFTITPNPTRGACSFTFDTGTARATSLAIFSIDGRRITRMLVPEAAARSSVLWNGRDSAGRAVPAGLYVVRLETGAIAQTRKLVIAR